MPGRWARKRLRKRLKLRLGRRLNSIRKPSDGRVGRCSPSRRPHARNCSTSVPHRSKKRVRRLRAKSVRRKRAWRRACRCSPRRRSHYRAAFRRNCEPHPASSAASWRSRERSSMTRNRLLFLAVSILFVFLFAVVGANAAEEGGNAPTERATEIFKWINFAILAGVTVWVFGKLLPPVFRKRTEAVSSAITNATNAKAAADAQLRDAESRLANLQKEVAELRPLAAKEAAAEVEGPRADTQSDAQKIA